jgi:hypothetical protein
MTKVTLGMFRDWSEMHVSAWVRSIGKLPTREQSYLLGRTGEAAKTLMPDFNGDLFWVGWRPSVDESPRRERAHLWLLYRFMRPHMIKALNELG